MAKDTNLPRPAPSQIWKPMKRGKNTCPSKILGQEML